MRIVIDKDVSEIQKINESWKKDRPTFKVLAVNKYDKFVYAKGLKTVNEAVNSVYDIKMQSVFDDCHPEVYEVTSKGQELLWSGLPEIVSEAGENNKKNATTSDKDKVMSKNNGGLLGRFMNWTKGLGGDIARRIMGANYMTKTGGMTGLGYMIASGQKKTNDKELKDALENILAQYKDAVAQQVNSTKEYNPVNVDDVEIEVKGDDKPVSSKVNVETKDGKKFVVQVNQEQGISVKNGGQKAEVDGNGDAPAKADGNGDAPTNDTALVDASKDDIKKAVKNNPTGAVMTIGQQVAKNTKDIKQLQQSTNTAVESRKWNFNDQLLSDKAALERQTIKRFFSEMNDSSVKNIKLIRADGTFKIYDVVSDPSKAYSEFKQDFRETTSKAEKEIGKFREFKVVVETSGARSTLNGFKFSDFGMADDFDSDNKTIVIKESLVKDVPEKPDGKKKASEPVAVSESAIEGIAKNPEPNGFTLELDVVDPTEQVKSLLASMNKYNGFDGKKIDDIQDGSIADGVTTYPDVEVVKEAEGDEDDEGGGDDAGGGGDAGGPADPFAGGGGDDAGGDDADPFAGGDDAGGGDAGGADADPFAGGGDDAGGGDAGGDADPFAGGGDDAGGGADDAGADAGTDDAGTAEGEPAADDAVNTDAQGNPKSQYNINVTRPFNVDDNFSLNEEEQKEFFGKIEQLVKIPDMDNFSLYLYQITPENMNLDDVHYIQALYDLSVKLGLLEDTYADSNLLDKYSSYKYSVVKDGEEDATQGEDSLTIQESSFPPKVQQSNQDNAKALNDKMQKKKNDDRRGPKEDLSILNLDKNGVSKPRIIDTTKDGWTDKMKTNGEDAGKAFDSTELGQSRGLGWLATFKAMQFGSPRYLTMYIKNNGSKDKKEKQCEDYLKRLSYTEIEFVNIEDVDPYEYVYRSHAGMKTPETIRTDKFANEEVPVTYFENKDNTTKVPESIPGDIQRDIKRVITKLNAEIRGTKQFNFLKECGVEKPQLDHLEFLTHYKTAQVNETLSETTYKFVLKKNDSLMSRMFFSNLKEKLFRYLGTFATKYNMECGCEATPKAVTISFMRSDIGNPGYDLETMIDADGGTAQ